MFPQEPGWLWDLIAQLNADPDAVAVSPTLLYEDLSIRYAGQAHTGPSAGSRQGLAGYPHHWLRAEKAERVERPVETPEGERVALDVLVRAVRPA